MPVQCAAVPSLRSLRMKALLTQVELAEKSGVSQPTIARIEAGKRPVIRVTTMRSLAHALGVTADTIDEFRPTLEGPAPAARG